MHYVYPGDPDYEDLQDAFRVRGSHRQFKKSARFGGMIWRRIKDDGEIIFHAIDVAPRRAPRGYKSYDLQFGSVVA